MRDLYRYVLHKYASQWEYIGIELDLDTTTVTNIKKDNPECTDRLKEILLKWLDSTPCNWKVLEVAITNVRRAQVFLDPISDVYGKNTSS